MSGLVGAAASPSSAPRLLSELGAPSVSGGATPFDSERSSTHTVERAQMKPSQTPGCGSRLTTIGARIEPKRPQLAP